MNDKLWKIFCEAHDASARSHHQTEPTKARRAGFDAVIEEVSNKLELLADEMDELYHRATREFDLPTSPRAYNAAAKDGKRWASPYTPGQVAEYLRTNIARVIE